MYWLTNSGKTFTDELTNWLIDKASSKQSRFQMSVYHKYDPDGSNLVVLYYDYDCVYWYTYKELWKWFVDTLGNRFHVKFIGYEHRFMYIRISQLKDCYILVYQSRYATFVAAKYLDTDTIK